MIVCLVVIFGIEWWVIENDFCLIVGFEVFDLSVVSDDGFDFVFVLEVWIVEEFSCFDIVVNVELDFVRCCIIRGEVGGFWVFFLFCYGCIEIGFVNVYVVIV